MGPVAVDYQSEGDEDGWSTPPPPSRLSSVIQNLPEFVKLVLASLLVALLVPLLVRSYFASLRPRRNGGSDAGGSTINGHVAAVGSSNIVTNNSSPANEEDAGSENIGQVVGDKDDVPNKNIATRDSGKKSKRKRYNAVADRNYDVLICKKPNEEQPNNHNELPEEKSKTNKMKSKREKLGISPFSNEEDEAKDVSTDTALPSQPQQTAPPPTIQLKSKANHPGLQGYYSWQATINSLYRIYAIPSYGNQNHRNISDDGNRKTYHEAILPMHPSSERGQVPVYIEVTNRTSHSKIDVYWVDYKGNEVYKGSIPNSGRRTWSQTTYIGHPWTFRVSGGGEENVLLKYAPFRIIPTIVGAETSRVEEMNGNMEGMQKFTIRDVPEDHVMRLGASGLVPVCWIEDAILPEPPLIPSNYSSTTFTTSEQNNVIEWSCQQIQREDAIYHGKGISSAKRLLQYLMNICLHPDDPKYRRLRLGNRIFQESIYNTGARGVLLALGFEELYGYMECGPSGGKMLTHERIRQISDAMMVVNRALKIMEGKDGNGSDVLAQPEGGDGFGRGGFGHAGGLNL